MPTDSTAPAAEQLHDQPATLTHDERDAGLTDAHSGSYVAGWRAGRASAREAGDLRPDRRALAHAIDPAIYADVNHLTGDGWRASLRAADAVLDLLDQHRGPVPPLPEPVATHPEHWRRHGHEGAPCPPEGGCYGGARYGEVPAMTDEDLATPDPAPTLRTLHLARQAEDAVTRDALAVDLANRAQEATGRGVSPSTVAAVLDALDARARDAR